MFVSSSCGGGVCDQGKWVVVTRLYSGGRRTPATVWPNMQWQHLINVIYCNTTHQPYTYTITINSTSVVDKNFYTLYLKGVLKIVGFRDIKILKSFISQFDIHNTRLINWRSMKKAAMNIFLMIKCVSYWVVHILLPHKYYSILSTAGAGCPVLCGRGWVLGWNSNLNSSLQWGHRGRGSSSSIPSPHPPLYAN